ncbi:MAG: class I SAM-dependent methyltransferase [Salaquimonas sp.]|nr:class I SAM-dependent methyltransferase [Salaquimonas sp.]
MSEDEKDEDFLALRDAARDAVNAIDSDMRRDAPERAAFFNAVYEQAHGDPAFVPWADLAPKPQLNQYLAVHPGKGRRAIDVACGLGDNAEALAGAGYQTTAFDMAHDAVEWARRRFPETKVDYRVANLLEPPDGWTGSFDLVNECYTLQSVPPEMLDAMAPGVANLVAPGGKLLVYTRIRPDDMDHSGPPWPLRESDAMRFADLGLELVEKTEFENRRPDRVVPHWFCVWRRG